MSWLASSPELVNEQQALGVDVEATDRLPLALRQARQAPEHRRAVLRIVVRHHLAGRLVVSHDARRRRHDAHLHRLAVDLDVVAERDALADVRRLPVDARSASRIQLLHVAARADAGLRQHFVQLGRVGLGTQHARVRQRRSSARAAPRPASKAPETHLGEHLARVRRAATARWLRPRPIRRRRRLRPVTIGASPRVFDRAGARLRRVRDGGRGGCGGAVRGSSPSLPRRFPPPGVPATAWPRRLRPPLRPTRGHVRRHALVHGGLRWAAERSPRRSAVGAGTSTAGASTASVAASRSLSWRLAGGAAGTASAAAPPTVQPRQRLPPVPRRVGVARAGERRRQLVVRLRARPAGGGRLGRGLRGALAARRLSGHRLGVRWLPGRWRRAHRCSGGRVVCVDVHAWGSIRAASAAGCGCGGADRRRGAVVEDGQSASSRLVLGRYGRDRQDVRRGRPSRRATRRAPPRGCAVRLGGSGTRCSSSSASRLAGRPARPGPAAPGRASRLPVPAPSEHGQLLRLASPRSSRNCLVVASSAGRPGASR